MRRHGIYTRALWLHGNRENIAKLYIYVTNVKSIQLLHISTIPNDGVIPRSYRKLV